MGKSDNVIKFQEAMKTDPKIQKAFDDALKRIIVEKSAESESEALTKAAREVGFDVSLEEIERLYAGKQEMKDDDLDRVAGGWCWFDDACSSWINTPGVNGDEVTCLANMEYRNDCIELNECSFDYMGNPVSPCFGPARDAGH